jgi:hypothetical protein
LVGVAAPGPTEGVLAAAEGRAPHSAISAVITLRPTSLPLRVTPTLREPWKPTWAVCKAVLNRPIGEAGDSAVVQLVRTSPVGTQRSPDSSRTSWRRSAALGG